MSALRLTGDVNLDDPNFNQSYSWDKAYQLSKQSMVLFTRELHRRYHGKWCIERLQKKNLHDQYKGQSLKMVTYLSTSGRWLSLQE